MRSPSCMGTRGAGCQLLVDDTGAKKSAHKPRFCAPFFLTAQVCPCGQRTNIVISMQCLCVCACVPLRSMDSIPQNSESKGTDAVSFAFGQSLPQCDRKTSLRTDVERVGDNLRCKVTHATPNTVSGTGATRATSGAGAAISAAVPLQNPQAGEPLSTVGSTDNHEPGLGTVSPAFNDRPTDMRLLPETLFSIAMMVAFGYAGQYLSGAVREHKDQDNVKWMYDYYEWITLSLVVMSVIWALRRGQPDMTDVATAQALIAKSPMNENPEILRELPQASMTRWWPIGSGYTTSLIKACFADMLEKQFVANAVENNLDIVKGTVPAKKFRMYFFGDTGDGYPSTRAVADKLVELVDRQVPGDSEWTEPLLILGGDLVYPLGCRADYARRFVKPFSEAFADRAALAESDPSIVSRLRDSTWKLPMLAIPGVSLLGGAAGFIPPSSQLHNRLIFVENSKPWRVAGNHDYYDQRTAFDAFVRNGVWYCPNRMSSLSFGSCFVYKHRFTKPDQLVVFGLDGHVTGDISGTDHRVPSFVIFKTVCCIALLCPFLRTRSGRAGVVQELSVGVAGVRQHHRDHTRAVLAEQQHRPTKPAGADGHAVLRRPPCHGAGRRLALLPRGADQRRSARRCGLWRRLQPLDAPHQGGEQQVDG